MFCPKCGGNVPEGDAYCPQCGARVGGTQQPPQSQQPPQVQQRGAGAPEYVAKMSVWAYRWQMVVSVVLLCLGVLGLIGWIAAPEGEGVIIVSVGLLVVALLFWLFCFVEAKCSYIEFYRDKIVTRHGAIDKKMRQSVFTPIVGVSVEQSLNGRIWNYGNVIIDKMGRGWDIDTTGIKNPEGLKRYLEGRISATDYSGFNNMFVQ